MLGKLIVRFMGIISTLILVRVLSPEDFGVVALGTMFIGLFVVLSDSGINRYLLLNHHLSMRDYHVAWTANVILRFFALLLTLATAPLFASYMESTSLVHVLQAIGFISFLASFNSVSLIALEKKVDFAPVNKIQIISKVISVIITISAAFYFRSYWALIIGHFVSTLSIVILSYVLTKSKPVVIFEFNKEMFSFASKLMLRNLIGYSRSQIDTLIVGKQYGKESLGGYAIAREFAILPQTEVIGPAMKPTFSILASVSNQKEVFTDKVFQSLFLIYSFVLPSAVGLYILAEPFVNLVLGPKWLALTEYIGILAFLMLPFATQIILHTVYDAANKTFLSMFADVFGLISIIVGVLSLSLDSVKEFAEFRVMVGLLALVFSFLLVRIIVGLSLTRLFLVLVLPVLVSALMYLVLKQLNLVFALDAVTLIINAGVGAVVYAAVYVISLITIAKATPLSGFRKNIPIFVFVGLEKYLLRFFK